MRKPLGCEFPVASDRKMATKAMQSPPTLVRHWR
jgi:hypothetical protein